MDHGYQVRRGRAKEAADELTEDFSAPIIPVLEIAQDNGVEVVFTSFGRHADKVAGFCDFQAQKIYVNNDDIVERKMFTIGHELGHWLLQKEVFKTDPDRYPVLPRFQSADQRDPLEREANDFAANLLVPARLLRPVADAPVSVLAKMFGVSKRMMEIRVRNVR